MIGDRNPAPSRDAAITSIPGFKRFKTRYQVGAGQGSGGPSGRAQPLPLMPAQLLTCSVAGVGCFTPPLATWRAPPEGRPEAVLRCGFALPRKGRANPPSVASGGDDRREEASFRLRKHGLLLAEQTAKSA